MLELNVSGSTSETLWPIIRTWATFSRATSSLTSFHRAFTKKRSLLSFTSLRISLGNKGRMVEDVRKLFHIFGICGGITLSSYLMMVDFPFLVREAYCVALSRAIFLSCSFPWCFQVFPPLPRSTSLDCSDDHCLLGIFLLLYFVVL